MSTRDKLLTVATRLFAAKGFAGAATDAIVRGAKVNKRMLYHYFGSKDGLYKAVLEAQWAQLGVALSTLPASDDLVMAVVDAAFDFVAANPNFLKLAMWEGLSGGHTSRRLWATTRGPLFLHAATLLGARAPKFDGGQLLISLLGALAFYFAFAHTLGDALGMEALSDQALQARKAHLHALLQPVFST